MLVPKICHLSCPNVPLLLGVPADFKICVPWHQIDERRPMMSFIDLVGIIKHLSDVRVPRIPCPDWINNVYISLRRPFCLL